MILKKEQVRMNIWIALSTILAVLPEKQSSASSVHHKCWPCVEVIGW